MKRLLVLLAAAVLGTGCAGSPAVGANVEPDSIEQFRDEYRVVPGVSSSLPKTMGADAVEPLRAPPLTIKGEILRDPVDAQTLADLRSLRVRFDVVGAPSTQAVAIEFRAPGEVVYERRTAALEGGPFAIQTLEFDLPVAGTVIDLNGLTGAWAAHLEIDGNGVASQNFELSP